jgi:hypothetical protein
MDGFSVSWHSIRALAVVAVTGLLLFTVPTLMAGDITAPGDILVGVPNNGNWPPNETPAKAIDDNINTKFLHFDGAVQSTGFRVTPSGPAVPVPGLSFTTANDQPSRDPIRFELYGCNSDINGTYTLIASGDIVDFSQATAWPRYTKNATEIRFGNSTVYAHYQILFPAVRNPASANSMQIAEVELLSAESDLPPSVDAGADQVMVLPSTEVQLSADIAFYTAIDPQSVQMEWTLLTAPDGVQVSDLTFTPDRFTDAPRVRLPEISGGYRLLFTVRTDSHTVSDDTLVLLTKSLCPPGDLNRDCTVDLDDLLVFAEFWLNGSEPLAGLPDLDGQNDGVSLSDFVPVASHWNTSGPSVVINEFLALNTARFPPLEHELLDEDGNSSDWIELCNVSSQPVDLEDWYLTDDPGNLTRWQIPALTMQPESFHMVFASGKNRKTPGEPYHTNFGLSGSPGWLALVEPDGRTIAHEFSYPAQYGGISYGLAAPVALPAEAVEVVSEGAQAFAKIPVDNSLGVDWTHVDFTPNGWLTGTTGVGYERQSGYEGFIGLNVGAMYYVNTSVYIRIPFTVDDPSGLTDLTLEMMYDDGFVAYLNDSIPIASANAPATVTWNSLAAQDHPDASAVQYQSFKLPPEALESLRVGQNVLSIHGLNRGLNSSDFLILPRLTAARSRSAAIASMTEAWFRQPTPGQRNAAGQLTIGPSISQVTRNPVPPSETEDLVITACVEPVGGAIGQVTLFSRVGFAAEPSVPMNDAGQGLDAQAGDHIYTAVIPASAYQAGDMVRWYVTAQDSQGIASREPAFLIPDNSPKYFGTVVRHSSLPVSLKTFCYFVQDTAAEGTDTGTRCSVFYLDEFYDNVFIRVRGGNYAASTGSRKIDFNNGYKFLFDPRFERVDEINLNGQAADSTFLRPLLSFEMYAGAGVAYSEAVPVNVIRNNSDPFVRLIVEQPDRYMLRRLEMDENGALYKVYCNLNANLTGEQPNRKVTRRNEDFSDLFALAAGIAPGNPNRGLYLFDNVNIPAVISYLAVSVLVHENDHTHKNYFLYRDTNGTGEWMFIPWDKDLTFGLNHNIAGIVADYDLPSDPQRSPSHPFYGTPRHQKIDYQWNRLFDAVFENPVTRQMYLRRLRTLMDEYLQAPGTPVDQLRCEQRIDQLAAIVGERLASPAFDAAVSAIKTEYLSVRRTHLYVNHAVGSLWPDDPAQIPASQPAQFSLQIGEVEFSPVSGNQDEEYIEIINPNAFAADISGWTVEDAVRHTFAGGTVIPAGGTLYLTPDAGAFRSRAVSPTGGQGLFVQGNYKGHLSSWGETITIRDRSGSTAASKTYAGNPSDVQRYLRITEIMYNPAPYSGSAFDTQDYEYVELFNIGTVPLLLNGVKFTKGIQYQFPDGIQLGAGQFLLLVKNEAAFLSRWTVPQNCLILGGYTGNLSNSGEVLKLDDQTNSTVLEFEYDDDWYPLTDGQGFSLVYNGALDAAPDNWDKKSSWRAGTFSGGSPGFAEQALAAGSIVINELLAHSHGSSPDWIELHNKTGQDINLEGWFLTDDETDLDTIRKYEIPANTILTANGYLLFWQDTSFGSPSQPAAKRFGLSENGETVSLFSGLNGEVTGYYHTRQKFDASETGMTLGRYEQPQLTGGYDFTRMAVATPGAPNSAPAIADVVITEIHYNPPAGNDHEFVELYNRSASPVTLMTQVQTEVSPGVEITEYLPWRLNGIGFTFPAGVVISPGQRILVARDPAIYASAPCPVYGPYDGKLDNAGEQIELQIPGDHEFGKSRAWIPIEKIEYDDANPWPTSCDGEGDSLTRIDPDAYTNDVLNWQAAMPTPGL